jgi:hypothetical protein
MNYEERNNKLNKNDEIINYRNIEQKSTIEQLEEAKQEIKNLQLEIDWLERSYD